MKITTLEQRKQSSKTEEVKEIPSAVAEETEEIREERFPEVSPPVVLKKSSRSQKKVRVRGANQHIILVRCNTVLYQTLQNMIEAAHTTQDFTHGSVADFIRTAIEEYRDGMELTELDKPGPKTTTTIRVDRATKDFYGNLPDRHKSKLGERAIRTLLKQEMKPSS